MKKGTITLLVIGVLILIMVGGTLTTYNGLIAKDEAVATAWGNIQSQYQRRADLIPNLVSTVKGYAKHESETLENVMAARAKAHFNGRALCRPRSYPRKAQTISSRTRRIVTSSRPLDGGV